MPEPVIQVTPRLAMPRSRYLEWIQGFRPPPGYTDAEARLYFSSGIDGGLYSEQQAAMLLERHRELEAAEAGPGDPEVPPEAAAWLTARGWTPPPGQDSRESRNACQNPAVSDGAPASGE